jgi:hypothetical protein
MARLLSYIDTFPEELEGCAEIFFERKSAVETTCATFRRRALALKVFLRSTDV